MNFWIPKALDLNPRLPDILSSSDDARAIVLDLAAGESLSDHKVHERAWLVVDGQVDVTTSEGGRASGGAGLLEALRAPPCRQASTMSQTTARVDRRRAEPCGSVMTRRRRSQCPRCPHRG